MKLSCKLAIRTSIYLALISSLFGCFEVEDETKHDVQIHWQAVTEFSDGSEISGIRQYQIYYGKNRDQLDKREISHNPLLTSYVIQGLSTGDYYFSIVAVSESGIRSEMSEPYLFQVSN